MISKQPNPEDPSDLIASNGFDSEQPPKTDAPFPIVGIAASAGGLEAFTALLRHVSPDTGMAFVLIQHLSPDHESLLSEILGRVTDMVVRQARDRMMVEPNEVYVIPPGTEMTLADGMLHLAPRHKVEGRYLPGDAFFESLAVDRGNKAIAVVLSGADGDGSQGLKAIKIAGGVTFAQTEDTAKFDSMPLTAVATGNVDFVLPPQAIAAELTALSRNPFLINSEPIQIAEELPEPGTALTTIFALLRKTAGIDFTHYKPTTINRRMQRRMLLYKLESLEAYAQYLQGNPAEVQALYEEILIHVTSFFRDSEAFEHLKTQVFPAISQNKSIDAPIRVWVAGCSTGEEVYSIVICLLEFFDDRATVPPIQVFATDISESAITKARAGFYLDAQMNGVSLDRRSRFFVPVPTGGYQVSSRVRELCVFARHNLGGDPPFSNLDLISCRNVLIYLSDTLQERVMALFHYSLNPTGYLMLGTSESVKTASNLFRSVNEPFKLYAKKLTSARPLLSLTRGSYAAVSLDRQPRVSDNIAQNLDLGREVDQLISNRYAPVSVVIDDQMHILQIRGDTDLYLKLTPGTTDLNVLLMTRDGLLTGLRTAVYQAQTQNAPIRQEQIQFETGDRLTLLNLEVIPFQSATTNTSYFLVIFEAVSPAIGQLNPASDRLEPAELDREVASLRQALAAASQRELAAQAHLQTVIQEQNYLNQNLRVANEEILSSNEELQSTNEELQTAKEEIQATNEELATTNDELRSRNLQQNRDNSDLSNFVASISIPIIMLTNELKIRRFTPTAQRLFNFIPADVGRPFSDLRANFDVSQLKPMILEVLDTLDAQEHEIQTQAGYWYSLRIRPYRTNENQIDGVTLVFLDIDALKRHADTLETARNYAETIVETVQIPLVVLDTNLQVNTANRSFYTTFQVDEAATEQSSLFDLGSGQWNIPQLRLLLEEILIHDLQIQNLEVDHHFEQIGQKTMLLNACKLQRDDNTDMILLSIEDITDRKQFEAERSQLLTQEQTARQQAEDASRAKDDFLSNLSHELRNPLNIMLGWSKLLRARTLSEAAATRALEVIERSALAQTQLVEDMLDVSRITSGKLNLNNRQIELSLVVQAAFDAVQLSAEAKNIQLVSALSAVTVVGDVDRLQQVFWNLFSNAIKFTPPDGRVDITLLAAENQAQIQVSDTGQGIRADLLPHVFDRFRQGDSSTTKAVAGLGLGLSIVRHLVELHGGTVQAESLGKGQGATLTVWLPLARSTPPIELETVETNSPDRVPSLAGLRILAVDDQVDTLELVKFVLEDYGADVLAVGTAREALSALSAAPNRYDVLISDIGMPEEDGYFLIQQVRLLEASQSESLGVESGSEILAIALTAFASDQEQQRAIDAGFQAHLAKPIEPAQLAWVVANLVKGR
ncbi:MAG: PAS domain-containing protein [Phormidesmis sp. CAN_BIN44]|nr:PAS domain-containing protein [Phormidesmis sp. CAN_BIN44]